MEKLNKVMIIDDDQNFIVPLEIGLKKRGIEVFSFNNPEEALNYLKKNKIDLVLTDYHMEPNINGDEVIRRIREFNKDIPIYLETAYAEDLPAEDMLDEFEIQGYIDKGEGQKKNIQLVKAGLKQAELIELVKNQKKEINAREYQNEFFGKFLNRLMGEIGERAFSIVGNTVALEGLEETIPEESMEVYKRSVTNIRNSISKLEELIKRLSVDEGVTQLTELFKTLNVLFSISLSIKGTELVIDNFIDNKYELVECNPKVVLYILVDIVEFLIDQEEGTINMIVDKTDTINIKVKNKITNADILEKINKLADLDDEINIIYNDEMVTVVIDKVL